ncbi:hypothetical protein NSZ01_01020 [Nocardioides szechwanensis]|nr:hypothetical protein NSZ01_01020 [Nocardioides szechwanensis]
MERTGRDAGPDLGPVGYRGEPLQTARNALAVRHLGFGECLLEAAWCAAESAPDATDTKTQRAVDSAVMVDVAASGSERAR